MVKKPLKYLPFLHSLDLINLWYSLFTVHISLFPVDPLGSDFQYLEARKEGQTEMDK